MNLKPLGDRLIVEPIEQEEMTPVRVKKMARASSWM
jgi:co-chaperonin GroES (HSP10)